MSETSIQEFLQQFSTSRNNVTGWPVWMQASAKVATASFPKTHHENVQQTPQAVQKSQLQPSELLSEV